MKKIAYVLLVTLLFSLAVIPAQAEEPITILVDGKAVSFDVAPIMKNDRVFIPLRAVGEALGAHVSWNEESQTVIISKLGTLQSMTLGNPVATMIRDNDQSEITLDVAPFTVNDRTLVPVRYVAEGFDATVDWDNDNNTVIIKSTTPIIMTVNGTDITEGIYNFFLIEYSEDPEFDIPFMFAFNQIAKEEGVTVTEQDIWTQSGATSKEEYQESYRSMIPFGMSEAEFDLCNLSSAYGNKLYEKKQNEATYEELQKFYQDEYVTAKHILLTFNETKDKETVKKQAEELLKRIKKGEDFDTLMNRYCEDPGLEEYPTGYTFTKGEMVEPFETAAFALKIGEVSELVETDFGFHIIKRMPQEDMMPAEIEALRNPYAYHFMNKVVETAEITKNQELIDSFNAALRAGIAGQIYVEMFPEG